MNSDDNFQMVEFKILDDRECRDLNLIFDLIKIKLNFWFN